MDCTSVLRAIEAMPASRARVKPLIFSPNSNVDFWLKSISFRDHAYKMGGLPTMARGLFIAERDGSSYVLARGYDKFFNIGETKDTTWDALRTTTTGPYEITAKENGCIILISVIEGYLIVTSKNSVGRALGGQESHADVGRRWLATHLQRSGKSESDLIDALVKQNLTAVCELADDEFEEHIIAYRPEASGLYLHGLNENILGFQSKSMQSVREFAEQFGLFSVSSRIVHGIDGSSL